MEIKGFTNAISAYKLNSYEQTTRTAKVKTATVRNKDTVEFSSRPDSVKSLKASIAGSVNESADTQKISQIKQKIQDGTYNIPAEIILKSIIG